MLPFFLQVAAPSLKPDSLLAFVLLDVAIILIAARICGLLSQRLGQPRVVGEIIAGVLLGPSLLGPEIYHWVNPPNWLQCNASTPNAQLRSITECIFPAQSRGVLRVLGLFALTFFMFLVGLELDYGLLKGRVRGIVTVAIGVVAVPVGLAFAIGSFLYDKKFVGGFGTPREPSELAFTLFVASMLAVTAFPVMARILQEKGLTASKMGSIGIAAAAVVTVLMFMLVLVATGVQKDVSNGRLAWNMTKVVIFVVVMFGAVRPLLALAVPYYQRKGLTMDIFAGVLILMFFCAYVATRLQVNVIVGGFLAGAVLPERKALFKDLSARLSDITATILLPIFLAFSGLLTDFTKLRTEHIAGIAIFLTAGIVGKWGGGALFGRLGGLSWSDSNVLGILMNCRGLLVLVVALIAFQAGVITAPLQVGGVLMALVTTMMTGPLFDRFNKSGPPSTPAPESAPPTPGPKRNSTARRRAAAR